MHGKFLGDVQIISSRCLQEKDADRTQKSSGFLMINRFQALGKGQFLLGAWAMDQAIMRSWTLTFSRP